MRPPISRCAQVLAGVLLFSVAFSGCGPAPATPTIAAPAAPIPPAEVRPETIQSVKFVDVTKDAGITFRHFNGATGVKLLPETMGSGVAFLDYDGDGDQDLFFVNSSPWPGRDIKPAPTQAALPQCKDGIGSFRRCHPVRRARQGHSMVRV